MAKKSLKKELVVTVVNSPAELIRTAVAGKADLGQLKELIELQERYDAIQAKKAYHKAMAEFKANLPEIIKDKKVSYTAGTGTVKYNHATLYNIMNKITPELSKYGLSVAWTHKQIDKEISVTCKITHAFGYSEETTITAPADTTGSKNAIQAIGSTISYLERYSVLGLIGAATKDQDDDALAAGPVKPTEYIGDKELHLIRDSLIAVEGSEKKFVEYMKIESLEKMLKSDYPKALAALTAAKKQKEGKQK